VQDFKNKKILITAGPTIEDIDPVRFLSNRSSGKMGLALADKAYNRGADVTLIIGPVHINIPAYLKRIDVRSAENMYKAVIAEFPSCDIFIASAAVADYTPLQTSDNKLKKTEGNLLLELKRTKDILAEIKTLRSEKQRVIGFSVETENLLENSRNKMIRKNLDMIIANNPHIKGAAFGADTNQVEIITKDTHITFGLAEKSAIADKILDHILLLEN
jgi:phosphopantothenoylcysteine decarboxylase / phosphopantothenate---cysteine ligase